jgi:predicted ribosome quality control (RQC) complex YloA/Tae2 family protein
MQEQRPQGDESVPDARGVRRQLLEESLAKARARVARRMRALEGDLARIASADELSAGAQLFVAQAARASRGTSKLTATDWTSGEPVVIELALDPARSPKEQVDAIFRRARRLKNGAPIARGRLQDAQRALERLDTLAAAVTNDPEADFDRIAAEARAAAPRDFAPPPKSPPARPGTREAPSLPYRTFSGASGAPIWVGRGAAQNDELTLHVARPHHLWLHAKGQAGAHVVVPLDKGTVCPPDLLVEAAHLAAHFSKARDEAVVEVTYVPRRYVRKPRGSPPGLVVVDREKTIALRRSEALLRRLLDRELAG